MVEKIKMELERKYKCKVEIRHNPNFPETKIHIRLLEVNRAMRLLILDEDMLDGADSLIKGIGETIEQDSKVCGYNPFRKEYMEVVL